MIVYFGFGREVATLLIAIFVAGYCVGPLVWGPLRFVPSSSREGISRLIPRVHFCISASPVRFTVVGRSSLELSSFTPVCRSVVLCPRTPRRSWSSDFWEEVSIPTPLAVSRCIRRELTFTPSFPSSAAFAACPLTNAGALIADIWDQDRRGIALAFFSLAPFAGPAIGPIVGGFMAAAGQRCALLPFFARSFLARQLTRASLSFLLSQLAKPLLGSLRLRRSLFSPGPSRNP